MHPMRNVTSSLLHEVLLQVVTVDLGPAEDDCLIHLVLLDGPDSVLPLQDFDSFRPHLWNMSTTVSARHPQNLHLSFVTSGVSHTLAA